MYFIVEEKKMSSNTKEKQERVVETNVILALNGLLKAHISSLFFETI